MYGMGEESGKVGEGERRAAQICKGTRGSVLRCGCIIFDGIQCFYFIKYIVCLCGICVFLVRNGESVAGARTHMVRLINIFVCHTCMGFFFCCLSFRRQFNCEHFHEFFINLSIILESKQRYGIQFRYFLLCSRFRILMLLPYNDIKVRECP